MVKTGLIEHGYTKILFLSIGFGHLEECIDFADGRDIVGNEWLNLGFKVNLLWFVTLNVFKHLLEILTHGQVRVLIGIVGTWNLFFILIIFIIFLLGLLLP